MKGRGDVDDALPRTGTDPGQRFALPTAATFDHITTALDHDDQVPGWVRFASATQRENGSDLLRR